MSPPGKSDASWPINVKVLVHNNVFNINQQYVQLKTRFTLCVIRVAKSIYIYM